VSAKSTKRHIDDVQRQLTAARESQRILEEQVALWRENLEESRIKALVSETPLQSIEFNEMSRYVQVAEAELVRRAGEVVKLTATRDGLLQGWDPSS